MSVVPLTEPEKALQRGKSAWKPSSDRTHDEATPTSADRVASRTSVDRNRHAKHPEASEPNQLQTADSEHPSTDLKCGKLGQLAPEDMKPQQSEQQALFQVLTEFQLRQEAHIERLLERQERRILEALERASVVCPPGTPRTRQAVHCSTPDQATQRAAAAAAVDEGSKKTSPRSELSAKSSWRRGFTAPFGSTRFANVPRRTVNEKQILESLYYSHSSLRRFSGSHISLNRAYTNLGCLQKVLRAVLTSRRFDYAVTGLLILNSLTIGAQADWCVRNESRDPPTAFRILEVFFIVGFVLELFVRIMVEGRHFFSWHNTFFKWNVLDTWLVAFGIVDQIGQSIGNSQREVSAARLIRMLRLVRIVRVVRLMRFFHDLAVMVAGILSSLRSLVWAMVLLLIIVFMFSIVFLEFVTDELRTTSGATRRDLREYFGSLAATVCTLYMSICGGIDWDDAASPLFDIHPILGLLFCIYIGFAVFCVLNIITAVFVDNMKRMGEKDEDKLVLEMLETRQRQVEEVKCLFSKLCNGRSDGGLSWEEFHERIADVSVQACFAKLGISIEDQATLFDVLDLDQNGEVSMSEFSDGIQLFNIQAMRVDVLRLSRENQLLHQQLEEDLSKTRVFSWPFVDQNSLRRSGQEDDQLRREYELAESCDAPPMVPDVSQVALEVEAKPSDSVRAAAGPPLKDNQGLPGSLRFEEEEKPMLMNMPGC